MTPEYGLVEHIVALEERLRRSEGRNRELLDEITALEERLRQAEEYQNETIRLLLEALRARECH